MRGTAHPLRERVTECWRRAGMPLFCTGLATKDTPAGMRIRGYQMPIEIGGVPVKPDDILVADEDGIVVVPRESLDAVVEKITLIVDVEAAMPSQCQS